MSGSTCSRRRPLKRSRHAASALTILLALAGAAHAIILEERRSEPAPLAGPARRQPPTLQERACAALDRFSRLRPVEGLRRVQTFGSRLLEATIIEAVEQADLGEAPGAALLARTLADGTYTAQMVAAFRAGEHAEAGKPLPENLREALRKLTEPPAGTTELGLMARYALNVRDWSSLPPANRARVHRSLMQEDPRYARIFLQHWEYQLPPWAPGSWKELPVLRREARMATPAVFYFTLLHSEASRDPKRYPEILLGRVEDRYRRLRELGAAGPDSPAVAELLALGQRLIDLGPVALDGIAARPHLLRMAVEAEVGERVRPGDTYLLDVLRGIGGQPALSVLLGPSREEERRFSGPAGEAVAWLMRGVKYPYQALRIYRWTPPPVQRKEPPAPPSPHPK